MNVLQLDLQSDREATAYMCIYLKIMQQQPAAYLLKSFSPLLHFA